MAVPKQKVSKSRGRKRRTHQKVASPTVIVCPECGESMLPHRVCTECGTYRGRHVFAAEDEE